jgi:hypothetical protein
MLLIESDNISSSIIYKQTLYQWRMESQHRRSYIYNKNVNINFNQNKVDGKF